MLIPVTNFFLLELQLLLKVGEVFCAFLVVPLGSYDEREVKAYEEMVPDSAVLLFRIQNRAF